MSPTAIYFFAFLAAVAQVVGILNWLKIEPKQIFSRDWWTTHPISISKGKLILVFGLGIFSLALSSYGFYLIHSSPASATSPTGIQIVSQTKIPSDDPQLPFGWEVVIGTDKERSPVQLFVICDGDIGKGHGKFLKGVEFSFPTEAVMTSGLYHPDVFNIKWTKPVWTPENQVVIQFFSKTPIRAESVTSVIYRPNTP